MHELYKLDRRATTLAALLAASTLPSHADDRALKPLAVVAGGFLIPGEQYKSYQERLEGFGSALTYTDESTLSKPRAPADGASTLLDQAEQLATQNKLAKAAPLVLLGHSRGCKTIIAAAARTKRRVAALVLVDPVDATGPDPSSVLDELSRLRVPTALIGSGKSAFDCAPTGSNYVAFADALQRARAPRLVALLPKAGHTQFIDNRRVLSTDVCTTGREPDALVREVALEIAAAWTAAAVTSPVDRSLREAAESLRTRKFGASVMWEDGDL